MLVNLGLYELVLQLSGCNCLSIISQWIYIRNAGQFYGEQSQVQDSSGELSIFLKIMFVRVSWFLNLKRHQVPHLTAVKKQIGITPDHFIIRLFVYQYNASCKTTTKFGAQGITFAACSKLEFAGVFTMQVRSAKFGCHLIMQELVVDTMQSFGWFPCVHLLLLSITTKIDVHSHCEILCLQDLYTRVLIICMKWLLKIRR